MRFKKGLKIFSILLVVAFLGFIGFVCFKINNIYVERQGSTGLLNSMTGKDEKGNNTKFSSITNGKSLPKDRPFSVLLMGVDSEDANLSGRSDTMIVAVVDPKKDKVSMLPVPRDTRTIIAGKGRYEKITHANAYSLNSALATVQNLLDIPIDYYIKINVNGFADLVDAMGGVEVDVEKDMTFNDRLTNEKFHLEKGVQKLDGRQALNYSRFRGDAEGDYGRMRRQQEVIKAIADQSTDFRNITKLSKILGVLGNNVRTDIKFTNMVKILLQVHDIKGDGITTIKMSSYPQMIDGLSYVIIPPNELARIQSLLQSKLSPYTD